MNDVIYTWNNKRTNHSKICNENLKASFRSKFVYTTQTEYISCKPIDYMRINIVELKKIRML